jgi:outer membrane protein assembly factor BamB
MVALNKRTGDLLWKAIRPEDRGAGHSSAVISEIGGTRVYVQSTGSGAMGVRASDGKLLWSYPIDKTTAVIPTPIVRDDLVFFVAGYKRGGALLRQIGSSDDSVTIEEVYGLKTELANKHGGVVLVGDYLFGDSDDGGIPYCAALATGERTWQSRGSGKGSAAMLAADGRLYIEYADGTLVLAKADPKEYIEVSSFKVPGSGERPSWAHPVIADGRLYLRENDRILCYDIRKR